MDALPYARQLIDDEDVAAVVQALRSEFLTTGPEVEAFEHELATAFGARHAIAVSSGTAALHCAYAAAGVGPGHEVITSPLTFSATASMAMALGARIRFADIDPDTLCLDPKAARAVLTPATRVVTPVDFAGHPADLDAFVALAREHGHVLVEDASHSLGTRYKGRPVGSIADMTVFSFHPVKTITTAEGGAVLTDRAEFAEAARDFRNHGLVRDRHRLHQDDGPWYYEIQSLGFNYRLSSLHAALGRSQLRKLARFVARRREIVKQYQQALSGTPGLGLTLPARTAEPAWHLFTVQLEAGAEARRRFFTGMGSRGIRLQVHYVDLPRHPLYRESAVPSSATPRAAHASERLVSLPLFPAMTNADVERVIAAVRETMAEVQ